MPLQYLVAHQITIAKVSFLIFNLYAIDLYGLPENLKATTSKATQTKVVTMKFRIAHSIEKAFADAAEVKYSSNIVN